MVDKIGVNNVTNLELSSDLIINTYYKKPLYLTKVVFDKAQDPIELFEYYAIDNSDKLNRTSEATYSLLPEPIPSSKGKFKCWAYKNEAGEMVQITQSEFTIEQDTTIYAVVETVVDYGGFIKGIVIFVIIALFLIILLSIYNKNKKKKKAAANVPTNTVDDDYVDYSNYYEKSRKHHERISDKRQKEKDERVIEQNYAPLINKQDVQKDPIHQRLNSQNNSDMSSNVQNKMNYNNQMNNVNRPNINSAQNAYQAPNQNNYTEQPTQNTYSSASSGYNNYQNSANNLSNNAGQTNASVNSQKDINPKHQSGTTDTGDINSILDKYKNLGSNNSNNGSNNL